MISDEELMAQAADGDPNAFATLVERHHRSAMNVAYRFLGDATLAEDVVQEAFLKILSGAGRYRPSARFSTYLYNVVWHLCVDVYRKRRPQSLEALPAQQDPAEGAESSVLSDERARLVQAAIRELPVRQRMALVLKHYENLSYEQVARALGCSAGAVESLLVRARRELRARLQGLL
jgi:RNA polymerase sigma-70 factor (ECF subfamily)